MKRATCFGLALASLVGCHYNLYAPPQMDPAAVGVGPGAGGAMMNPGYSTGDRRFPNVRSQIAFVSPVSMKVGWETFAGGMKVFLPAQMTVPGRYNFEQGAIYRLKLTEIPGHPGVPFYPTLEVAPSTPRTDAFLTHNQIPIEFTDEDFDQVSAGNFVTKVIYLPDPQNQELAIAGVETLVSTRLEPGVDPVAEADRRGTILAIVRMGGIDLEMPQSPPVSPYAGPQNGTVMMAPSGAAGQPAAPGPGMVPPPPPGPPGALPPQ